MRDHTGTNHRATASARPAILRGRSFAAGLLAGVAATLAIGATRPGADEPRTARPVQVTLHRFDTAPGQEARFAEWIDFLHLRHRDAVATLTRERTYFEAMFTAPDEPRRLYWLEVRGTGGASVESSPLDLDVKHRTYMAAVVAKGSHRRLDTRNVLTPDFVVRAVAAEQRREGR